MKNKTCNLLRVSCLPDISQDALYTLSCLTHKATQGAGVCVPMLHTRKPRLRICISYADPAGNLQGRFSHPACLTANSYSDILPGLHA